MYETQVYRKETKTSTQRSSSIPKRYNRDAISIDFNQSKRVSSNIGMEVQNIKSKLKLVGYPFIANVICTFKEKKIDD